MPPELVIGTLAGAVATLTSAFALNFREQLQRADARLERQEKRQDELLTTMHTTLTQLALTVTAMNEAQQQSVSYINEQAIIARERERARMVAREREREGGAGQ
jgi:hypothetical protein